MRATRFLLTALIVLCLATTVHAVVGTLDIPLTQGLHITGYAPLTADTNYSFGSYGTIANSPSRLLFKFGALDRFSSISSAVVTLSKTQTYAADGLNVDSYQVTSTWGTGTNWNNQPGYGASPIASARWNNLDGDGQHFSLDVTSTVQGWLANPSTNNGFMFKQQDEGISQDIWYFDGAQSCLSVTGELLPEIALLTFSPDGGTYDNAVDVTISCATPGVTIRCTTDGSEPTQTTGAVIPSGTSIRIVPTVTLKAKAWRTGYYPSPVKSATFTCPTYIKIPFSEYRRITGAQPNYSDTNACFGGHPTGPLSPSRLLGKFNLDRLERIDTAYLNMYQYQTYVATLLNADCHKVTSPWGVEATWATQPTFNATPSALASWRYGAGDGHNYTLNLTTLAKSWLTDPATNLGIMLKQHVETAIGDLWYFDMAPEMSYLRVTGKLAFSPEIFGAVGDGVTDDTTAFQRAALAIQAAGGGTFTLTAGKTYRVGRQYHAAGQYPYYIAENIFTVQDLPRKLTIVGNNALVKMNDGMRYGSFDKLTGAVINPTMPFGDPNCAVAVGNMFKIINCADVEIRDLRVDGNNGSHILGGQWGDTGRQISSSGMYIFSNRNVLISNCESSYNALDGIMIGYPGLTVNDPPKPQTLQNVKCFYNARQGLSWVGGRGLTVTDSKFSHTGRGAFSSAPGAGLDMEAELSIVRDGTFTNCEFVNNTGNGLVADSGDVANATFTNCLFWGSTSYAAWPKKPGLQFTDCTFRGPLVNAYGSTDPTQATQFLRCTFDDQTGLEYPVMQSSAGMININAQNVKFDTCTFQAHNNRSMWVDGTTTTEIFTNCSIYHYSNSVSSGSFQALIRGANMDNTHFYEVGITNPYYLNIQSVHVGPNVYVDGPKVRWQSTNGLIGLIPEN